MSWRERPLPPSARSASAQVHRHPGTAPTWFLHEATATQGNRLLTFETRCMPGPPYGAHREQHGYCVVGALGAWTPAWAGR